MAAFNADGFGERLAGRFADRGAVAADGSWDEFSEKLGSEPKLPWAEKDDEFVVIGVVGDAEVNGVNFIERKCKLENLFRRAVKPNLKDLNAPRRSF